MLKHFVIMSLLVMAVPVTGQAAEASYRSEKGLFRVSYESELEPIAINLIHSWRLHVTDAGGEPVTGAEIEVEGGMPEHNHGLATSPDIRAGSDGDYLLQGLRFHMLGYWELELTIRNGTTTDTVVIPLEL